MSNVTYDMDTSGGLMPLIRALIKPPDEEPSVPKPKKSQHPYYKRPGKGHNHDSCDACGEGGDLICCDRCPASFHLGCYDPPLDENDIPAGLWLCRECRASDAEKPASARGSRAQSPADSKSDTEKKTRSLRSRDSKKRSKEDSSDSEEKEKEKEKEEKELTPMEILVKAARIMNPTQFELPREMRIPCIFPGTEKEGCKGGGPGVVTVDASGCVPLPAKACFVCRGTCRVAPLLQCDYCPLLFHQDCLDPPLTALPTGRWMCPNHVEQFIDWKLVNSISATERVALWDRWSGPLDQHAVKIDFIRHARRHRPRFRQKVPISARGRVRVPVMVKLHYESPPPLLPSRREHVRCRNALNRLKQSGAYSESEDEDAPKHQVCLNPDCDTEHNAPGAPVAPQAPVASSEEDAGKPAPMEKDSDSSSLSDSDFEYVTAAVKRRRGPPAPVPAAGPPAAPTRRLALGEEGKELLAVVEPQLDSYDDGLLKILAWQRLRQILAGEQCAGAFRHSPLSAAAARAVLRALPALGPARALPSDLLSRADRERIATAVWGAAPAPPASPADLASPAEGLADACVRATFCPTSGAAPGRPVPMRSASVCVGADSGCDVRLQPALCRRVSRNHAVIFMDEVTRHFELINYSEFGTIVNGVLYACDVTRVGGEAAGGEAGGEARDEADSRADALRQVVSHRQPKPIRINGSLTAPLPNEHACRCPPLQPEHTRGAWEGSALLPHGALLQFGCQTFVFSITGTAETEDVEPAL